MNYSMILMTLVTSQIQQLQADLQESLEPRLQELLELVTTFFVPGTVPGQRLGLRTDSR
jgi:hypothetical protein